MKTMVLTSLISISALFSTTLLAQSSTISFVQKKNTPTSSLCAALTTNKPLLIAKRLKDARLTKERARKVLLCNGLSLPEFTHKYNLHKAMSHLDITANTRQASKSKL